MNANGFTVSTKFLAFSKNKISTQEIRVNGAVGSVLKMTHTLPKGFTLDPPYHDFICPGRLNVTYNSFIDEQEEKKPLKINISKDFRSKEVAEIVVKIVDEEEAKSDALECQICLRQFDEDNPNRVPKVLSGCGHTMCVECLDELSQRFPIGMLQCPFDRKTTNGEIHQYPKNFAIISMIREKNELEEKERLRQTQLVENPNVPCFENSKHESTSFCTTCNVDFCRNCFNSTHSSKIFSVHKTIPIDNRPITVPACPRHPETQVLYVCMDRGCQVQNKIFCGQCLGNSHGTHNYKNYMEVAIENKLKLEKIIKDQRLQKIQFKSKESTILVQISLMSYSRVGGPYTDRVAHINRKYTMRDKEAKLKHLERHVDEETNRLQAVLEQNERDWNLIEELKGDIEKKLKRKTDMHCINDLIERVDRVDMFDVVTNEETFGEYLSNPYRRTPPPEPVAPVALVAPVAPVARVGRPKNSRKRQASIVLTDEHGRDIPKVLRRSERIKKEEQK